MHAWLAAFSSPLVFLFKQGILAPEDEHLTRALVGRDGGEVGDEDVAELDVDPSAKVDLRLVRSYSGHFDREVQHVSRGAD